MLPLAVDAANANVWAFGIALVSGGVTTFGAFLAYLANRNARSARVQTEHLTENTKTNRASEGNLGLSIDQLHDKVDAISDRQRQGDQVLEKVVKKTTEIAARVSELEGRSPSVDLAALNAALDS